MKNGRSLVSLAQELERQLHSKKDLIVPSTLVRHATDDLGALDSTVIEEGGSPVRYGVTPGASPTGGQAENPVCLFRAHARRPAGLLDRNVNTWLQSEGRAAHAAHPGRSGARRVVGSLPPPDNFDLAESVLPILQQLPEVRFRSVELTETKMYLKCITPRLKYEMAPGDVVQAGVVISNSEVGQGTLSVQPLLFRLVCSNGLIAADRSLRKTHVGRALGAEDERIQVPGRHLARRRQSLLPEGARRVVQAAVSGSDLPPDGAEDAEDAHHPAGGRPGEDGRGAGPALHAERQRARRRAAPSDRRPVSCRLWPGQCGHALQPGGRGLRPRDGVRSTGRPADRLAGP